MGFGSDCAPTLVIIRREEGHLRQFYSDFAAALLCQQLGLVCAEILVDVGHSDGFLEAGTGTATAGLSYLLALFGEDLAVLADHTRLTHYKTNTFVDALGLVFDVLGQLTEHIFTDELHTSVCGLTLEDGPHQSAFKRSSVSIDVMAVQAKTSLQSQGVPRAETSHLHCWILQQCFSYIDHVLPQSRNLKPVFSSVPRSSDRVINSCKLGLELRHKWHFAEGHSTDQRLQGLCALRTLQRNQPVFLKVMNFCVEVLLRDDFLDMLDHNVLIRPIDHDPNGLLRFQVGRNSVINDSSPLIKEHRKVTLRHTRLALPAGISHSRPLQQFHAIRPSKHQLTHMADIKDRGTASAMQMLLDDSLRVVDRQVVTCKLNDFSLLGDMQLLEAGVLAC